MFFVFQAEEKEVSEVRIFHDFECVVDLNQLQLKGHLRRIWEMMFKIVIYKLLKTFLSIILFIITEFIFTSV